MDKVVIEKILGLILEFLSDQSKEREENHIYTYETGFINGQKLAYERVLNMLERV